MNHDYDIFYGAITFMVTRFRVVPWNHKLLCVSQNASQRRSGLGWIATQFVDAGVADGAPVSGSGERERGERKSNGRKLGE